MNGAAALVVARAQARGKRIATAESCTGGLIAAALTGIAGASNVFGYGFVSYANEAKAEMLGVPMEIIERYGAVSEPVVMTMADGARERADSDLAIAVTGIAGPDGGTPEKPVGTVWFALARREGSTRAMRMVFEGDRATVREATARYALEMLADALA